MDTDNRKWFEEALSLMENASRRNVLALIVRHNTTDEDSDAEAEIVMTNAATPEIISALFRATETPDDSGDA